MVIENRLYDVYEAFNILKSNRNKKFIENIEVAINLSFLPKNKNFVIKGYSILPYGNFKPNKVAIFSLDNSLVLGYDDNFKFLTELELNSINKKNLFFDLIVTTPSSMVKFGKLGKILGSKNLMPDIKYGTITTDIKVTLDLLKKNYLRFKSDKGSVINAKIGQITLDDKFLLENLLVLISDIKKNRPKDCKAFDINSLYLTSTMGSGFKIDIKSLFS